MEIDIIGWGDLLSNEVINRHKDSFLFQPQPNYFLRPIKYLPSDTWVTHNWWIETGLKLIDNEIDILTGLEIILNTDKKKEYVEKAYLYIEDIWKNENNTLYDIESYYNILVHLPEGNEIRESAINYIDMDGIEKNDLLRNALIRANDEKTCHYIARKIKALLDNKMIKDNILEEYIMPRMIQFGCLWKNYFNKTHIDLIKNKCLNLLEHDKWITENNKEEKLKISGKRCIWVKDVIATWSFILDWQDIIKTLKASSWYWDRLCEVLTNDYDNENFLSLSYYSNDLILQKKAIEMMESYQIDGAIAWSRMRRI